jgi:hypothetical protein
MATISRQPAQSGRLTTAVARASALALTLATAGIHASLGGLMFTATALGYASLALALVLPGPFERLRWLVRLALIGFTMATIAGWVAFGARFGLAYVDKAIELLLVAFAGFDLLRSDGGPVGIARRLRDLATPLIGGGRERA